MKKILLCGLAMLFAFVLYAQDHAIADTLQQYTGKYKFPDGSIVTEVTVTLDSNSLTISSVMGSSELRKTNTDVFEIVVYGGIATFKRNTEGKIIGLNIVVGDINIEGTKTEGIILRGFSRL